MTATADESGANPILALMESRLAKPWRLRNPRPGDAWIVARRGDVELPGQGWKLHVSSSLDSAVEVLDRCLAVLSVERCGFKVAASVARLRELNLGLAGATQVGKFITVYPEDDAAAVRLADALHLATTALEGPPIPSDRRFGPGSLVHYRYGSFDTPLHQSPTGMLTPSLRAPDGTYVADLLGTVYRQPAWAVCPFPEPEPEPEAAPASDRVIAGRFLVIGTLQRSPLAAVQLAVDVAAGERRVLKRTRTKLGDARDAEAARGRLRREAEVLKAIGPLPGVPALQELVEH